MESAVMPFSAGRRNQSFPKREGVKAQKHWRSTSMRTSGARWKMSYCGIFCAPQEGSEVKGKIRSDLSAQKGYPVSVIVSVICRFFRVSRSGYDNFFHRLGRPEKNAALAEITAEQRSRSFRTYGLPQDVADAEKTRHSP